MMYVPDCHYPPKRWGEGVGLVQVMGNPKVHQAGRPWVSILDS